MLKILKSVFGLIGAVLAIFALITGRFVLLPYMLFFLGVMNMIMGLQEKRMSRSIPLFLVSGFGIFVSIFIFLMH